MHTLISDMHLAADAIEHTAFEMRAPNEFTPRFVTIANTMRQMANEATQRRREFVESVADSHAAGNAER